MTPAATAYSFSLVTPRFKDAICSVASRYGCFARLVSGGKMKSARSPFSDSVAQFVTLLKVMR
jgi:hypothetical protein